MKYLRVNYRTTGGRLAFGGELESALVAIQVTIQHDSATGRVVTFSLEGYGRAAWALVFPASETNGATTVALRTSVASDSSLIYMTCSGATASYNSLGATISIPYDVIALIASR